MINKFWLLVIVALFSFCKKSGAQGTWHNLDGGLLCTGNCDVTVSAICPDTVNNVLYVGGTFNEAGNKEQLNISRWDGTKWDSLSERILPVTAMIMYKGELYVGDENTGLILRYDGTHWNLMPYVDGQVLCFAIYKDTLYAGGTFTTNDSGVLLNNVAKWNGTDWMPLDSGVDQGGPEVNAMCVYNDTLFVGGIFYTAGNKSAKGIAKWDGTNWWSVGKGIGDYNFPGMVNALETYKGNLYAGGEFDSAGGKLIRGIAEWNGMEWDTLNSDISSDVFVLKSFYGYLFIGGDGAWFGGNMAKYDGNNITPVNSGVNALVYSLAVLNDSLYVGGEFDTAGKTVPANHIARWTPDTSTGIKQATKNTGQLLIYPNPASNQLTFSTSTPIEKLQIENVLGQTLLNKVFDSELQKQTIDVSTLPQGIYFYRVTDSNSQMVTGKFVLVK